MGHPVYLLIFTIFLFREPVDEFLPYNPQVTPCEEGVGDQPGCSCTDCESACVATEFPVYNDEECKVFNGISCISFAMFVVFVVGTVIFLAIIFVATTMSRYFLIFLTHF